MTSRVPKSGFFSEERWAFSTWSLLVSLSTSRKIICTKKRTSMPSRRQRNKHLKPLAPPRARWPDLRGSDRTFTILYNRVHTTQTYYAVSRAEYPRVGSLSSVPNSTNDIPMSRTASQSTSVEGRTRPWSPLNILYLRDRDICIGFSFSWVGLSMGLGWWRVFCISRDRWRLFMGDGLA